MPTDVHRIVGDGSCVGPQLPTEQLDQRRFAGAVRSDHQVQPTAFKIRGNSIHQRLSACPMRHLINTPSWSHLPGPWSHPPASQSIPPAPEERDENWSAHSGYDDSDR